jgi:hypothetical protein
MKHMKRLYAITVVLYILVALSGCSDAETSSPTDPAQSPAEYFNEHQQDTMTPHGKVVPGSAKDVGDGRFQYDTDDGSTFEATVSPNESGGYQIEDVEKVTDTK